jgi:nucleotide-binding universal stress UspA family protein
MFKRIMVPLDGSELAEKVLPFVVGLTKQLDGELLLLAVVEPGVRYVNPMDGEIALASEAAAIDEAETYLEKVRNTIIEFGELDGAKIRGIVSAGNPAEQIVDLAPFENADLLVMTTHARTGLSRLVLGSIATGVLRLTDRPTILFRPADDKTKFNLADALSSYPTPTEAPRMVISLDGSPEAETVVMPAADLAAMLGATVYLVRVEMPPVPVEYGHIIEDYGAVYGREIMNENKQRKEAAYHYLDKVEAQLSEKGTNCVKVVRFGEAADQIIGVATEVSATLLVMATHARGRIGQFMLGSVSEEVMRRSHLPVLMLHTARKSAKAHAEATVAKDTATV